MRLFGSVALLSLMLTGTAPLAAQSTGNAATDSTRAVAVDTAQAVRAESRATTAPTIGAPMTGLRSGIHSAESQRPAQPNATAAATRAGLGQARAMMIVGVAAMIAGGVIGGDPGTIIMIGGAVIALIGLYDFLQ